MQVNAGSSALLMGLCIPACDHGWRFMVAKAAPCPPRIQEGYLCWQRSFSHRAREEDHTTCHSDWCLPRRHKLKGKEENVMKRRWRIENAPRVGDEDEDDLSLPHHRYSIHRIDILTHKQNHTLSAGSCTLSNVVWAKLLYFTEDLSSVSLMCRLLLRRREKLYDRAWIKWKGNKKLQWNVMSMTSLCIAAIFIMLNMGGYTECRNCYLVISSLKWGIVCSCRCVIQARPTMNFQSLHALISAMICFYIIALHCVTEVVFFFFHGQRLYIMMRANII